MLDGYGLRRLTWDSCDERFGDVLVASPADVRGRGILLEVRQDGLASDLEGASVYLLWLHRVTGERGAEPFSAVDAAAGTFSVRYPMAMRATEGTVDAQVLVSCGDGTCISSRVFCIRVEPVLVGGDAHEDVASPFLDALLAYERARDAADEAAARANGADAAVGKAVASALGVADSLDEAVASAREAVASLSDALAGAAGSIESLVGERPPDDAGMTVDLGEYATREWVERLVESAVAGFGDLSEVTF